MLRLCRVCQKNELLLSIMMLAAWALSRVTFDFLAPSGASSVVVPLIIFVIAYPISSLVTSEGYLLVAGFERKTVALMRYVALVAMHGFGALMVGVVYFARYRAVEYGAMFCIIMLIYIALFVIKHCAFLPIKTAAKSTGKAYLAAILASAILTVAMLSTVTTLFGNATIATAKIVLAAVAAIAVIAVPLSAFFTVKYFDDKDF